MQGRADHKSIAKTETSHTFACACGLAAHDAQCVGMHWNRFRGVVGESKLSRDIPLLDTRKDGTSPFKAYATENGLILWLSDDDNKASVDI